MRNVQRRTIDAPMDRLGALLDRVAAPDGPLWPAPAWPPMRFDRPLGPGATGGHGMIRYTVVEHVPGRLLRCRFDPAIGVVGEHELRLEPAGRGTALVHVIDGRLTGGMRLWWPLAVRWLHEALLQDLLDNAERAATGTVRRPARWSWWVRLMRRAVANRSRKGTAGGPARDTTGTGGPARASAVPHDRHAT
ncbi:SRPBCC family protein [Dactylosporangium sp. NPDC050688]|uniref:SRPBCC family protein n=1 Tax=Dactylosporangium sp. NPDC050688 TaxID=3157217 RepID=UPI0033EAF988